LVGQTSFKTQHSSKPWTLAAIASRHLKEFITVMSEIWNSIITGAVGGLIVLGVQEFVSHFRSKKKLQSEKFIKSTRSS